jgi:hypothetical protein
MIHLAAQFALPSVLDSLGTGKMRRPNLLAPLACSPACLPCLLVCWRLSELGSGNWVCEGGAVVGGSRVRRICVGEGVWEGRRWEVDGGRRAARLNESCGEWGRKAGSGGQRGEAAGALVQ